MKLSNGLRRLGSAIDRHGARAVARALAKALFRHGPGGVIKAASGDQPFAALGLAPGSHATRRPAWPPSLDGEGAVPAQVWARWTRRVPPVPAGPSAKAGWRMVLEAGDIPAPELATELDRAAQDPAVQIVTFDLFRRLGDRVQPLFLPGANLPFLTEAGYAPRVAVKGAAADAALDGRQAILAWCEGRSVADIRKGWRHIGLPLVEIAPLPAPPRAAARPPAPGAPALGPASAIICTRDKGHLTRQLVRQLLAQGPDLLAEVLIVSNGTASPHGLQTLADLAQAPRVRVISRDEPFNFSRLCNAGVRETGGSGPLLFLNDDIAPVSEDWLAVLLARLAQAGTGAVGPLLLYPDERVQHAGLYLKPSGGAGHYLRGARLPQDDPMGLAACAREVSALTGAVMLTDRALFDRLGGFDEDLAISFQDVDYGLKVHAAGLRSLFEPRSILLHMESASVGGILENPAVAAQRYREKKWMQERWPALFARDPFLPAGLDPEDERLLRLGKV